LHFLFLWLLGASEVPAQASPIEDAKYNYTPENRKTPSEHIFLNVFSKRTVPLSGAETSAVVILLRESGPRKAANLRRAFN
jgi:hypothetical protein